MLTVLIELKPFIVYLLLVPALKPITNHKVFHTHYN